VLRSSQEEGGDASQLGYSQDVYRRDRGAEMTQRLGPAADTGPFTSPGEPPETWRTEQATSLTKGVVSPGCVEPRCWADASVERGVIGAAWESSAAPTVGVSAKTCAGNTTRLTGTQYGLNTYAENEGDRHMLLIHPFTVHSSEKVG